MEGKELQLGIFKALLKRWRFGRERVGASMFERRVDAGFGRIRGIIGIIRCAS